MNHVVHPNLTVNLSKREPIREVTVMVPSRWSFLERLETKQEEIQGDKVCALVAQWKFWELVAYSGQSFADQDGEGGADWSTRSYYPKPRRIEAMAEESLRLISTALERKASGDPECTGLVPAFEDAGCVQARIP